MLTSRRPTGFFFLAAAFLAACAARAPEEPSGGASGASGSGGGGTTGTGGASGAGGAGDAGAGGEGAGAAGAGGSGAVAGAPGTGGTGGTAGSGACAAASFCTGFEQPELPAALAFYPEYQRQNLSRFVSLDDSQAHAGTRSLKISGTDFSQMLGVAVPGENFWMRVYLRSDTDMQPGHNTYVAATDGNGDPNAGEHVRVGEHQCQLELNRKSDDKELLSNGGTYACTGGIKLLANTWYCLEAHFDGPDAKVRVYVDGDEVQALAASGWGPYAYKLFKFGFEKYHGGAKTLWYDDLALGSVRIGCHN